MRGAFFINKRTNSTARMTTLAVRLMFSRVSKKVNILTLLVLVDEVLQLLRFLFAQFLFSKK